MAAISVPRLKNGECKCTGCIGGCTNPYSPNYDPKAQDDDGSCKTCQNQGLCVLDDPDGGSNCNAIGNGCCDEYCLTANDCSPTFQNSFTSKDGNYKYPSCYG